MSYLYYSADLKIPSMVGPKKHLSVAKVWLSSNPGSATDWAELSDFFWILEPHSSL